MECMTALQMRGAGEFRISLATFADSTARSAAKADNAATTPVEGQGPLFREIEAVPDPFPVSHRLPPNVSEGGSR